MTGKVSTSLQGFIQTFLVALVVALVANPAAVTSLMPKEYVDVATVCLGALAVALHQHGVNRDSQGNVIPPPPK